MTGDFRRNDASTPNGVRPPLKTHDFGWDPLERVRLVLRGATARFRPASTKRVLLSAAAGALAIGALAGASALGVGSDAAPATTRESALDKRESELRRRETAVAALEERQAAAQDRIKQSQLQIEKLETRRTELERQVAELTAPVAPASTGEAPADLDTTTPDDPSLPDGDRADAGETAAPTRARVDAPSSAMVDGVAQTTGVDALESRAADEETAEALPRDEALASTGPLRVFIHVRSTDRAARERAEAVAAELRRRGVAIAAIRGVPRAIRRDAVRYFYDADRGSVSALQDAVRQATSHGGSPPQSQDFRGYRASPKQGTLELWLS